MELLNAFGLDYKLLLANLINFVILLFLLKKVLYKPLIQFISDRTKTIQQGIDNAEHAEKVLVQAQVKQEEVMRAARTEASGLIEKARAQAEAQAQELLKNAATASAEILAKAQQDIQTEQAHAMQQAKQEIASLVLLTTEKVLRQKLDTDADRVLIEKQLKEL